MPKVRVPRYSNEIVTPVSSTVAYFYKDTDEVLRTHRGELVQGRYGRYHNNNWVEVEHALAELDECEGSLLFPSGMSAISSLMMCFASQGDRVVFSRHCYRNIRTFFEDYLIKQGIEVYGIEPPSGQPFLEALDQCLDKDIRILFLEIPSNPHLHLLDITLLREKVGNQCLIVVDSTFASPINYKPIRFGADLVVHSCTKYLGGHGDLMAGCVNGRTELIEQLRTVRNVTGAIPSPQVAALLMRSLATLDLRIKQANYTGLRVARFLEQHDQVKRVFYTGLPSHPDYHLAKLFLEGHGGVVTFELAATGEETTKFVDAVTVPYMGTHFGSTLAMIEQLAVFTYYMLSKKERERIGITDSMVRLSVGLHDPDRIIQDLRTIFSQCPVVCTPSYEAAVE